MGGGVHEAADEEDFDGGELGAGGTSRLRICLSVRLQAGQAPREALRAEEETGGRAAQRRR